MAQPEDTELRDLVIEALERNGSLAKIRALLRANIFLAFEDECENMKQNLILDNILKLPEGTLALSIVHEFLEYCNLKNSLFVYMSESRQGNQYSYDGKKSLAEKLHMSKCENLKEPILITLLKNAFKLSEKKYLDQNDSNNVKKQVDSNYKDEQNCTYIIHEDSQSSSTSNSQSENSSSDEKNKLHLSLRLDNSDTDTSSDSARDKTSSEYVPGDHIIDAQCKNATIFQKPNAVIGRDVSNSLKQNNQDHLQSTRVNELKLMTNSSSKSTSYIDLKPFNSLDEKMINTAGLPSGDKNDQVIDVSTNSVVNIQNKIQSKSDSEKSASISNRSLVSAGNDKFESGDKNSHDSFKSDGETADYSFDFSLSPASKHKDRAHKHTKALDSGQENLDKHSNKQSHEESIHQASLSSQSSVSLSDVADLISEKSFVSHHTSNDKSSGSKSNSSGSKKLKEKIDSKQSKIASDDSGDFTESPVPSLSNLSLDIHSD